MAAAAPSTMPARTGVPAAKPLAAAASAVTRPTICAQGSAGGSLAASSSMAAISSADQHWAALSKSMVSGPTALSMQNAPQSR